MNVRKIGLRTGMAFLLILLLFTAGCGRQAQEEESAPEKTVVTLWHYSVSYTHLTLPTKLEV